MHGIKSGFIFDIGDQPADPSPLLPGVTLPAPGQPAPVATPFATSKPAEQERKTSHEEFQRSNEIYEGEW